jgi:hypothetical protein
LAGTLREHARIYRAFNDNKIGPAELEIRSRHLRRHTDILGTIEQAQQLDAIQEQLKRINGGTPPGQEFLPGPEAPEAE